LEASGDNQRCERSLLFGSSPRDAGDAVVRAQPFGQRGPDVTGGTEEDDVHDASLTPTADRSHRQHRPSSPRLRSPSESPASPRPTRRTGPPMTWADTDTVS